MGYRQDISRCLETNIGRTGLDAGTLEAALERAGKAARRLRARHDDGSLAILKLPGRRDDIAELADAARRLLQWPTVVVIGTGGSSLGGQCIAALPPAGTWPGLGTGPGRCVFIDNVDPGNPWLAPAATDVEKVSVLAISKSGGTMETLAQLLVLWEALSSELGGAAAERFLVVTEPGDNPMRRFAERQRIPVLDHDPAVGGRFSVLSLVGLLPAIIAGRDPEALRAGADSVLGGFLSAKTTADNPAALGAAVNIALAESRGVSIVALCPYADALEPFARWFAQLWGESLGKDGHGTTPVAARGAVDQHSQLQLWLDGPRDKLINVLSLPRAGAGARLPADPGDPELDYLAGRTIGDLMEAEQRATIETLASRGVPVRHFALDAEDEETLGALFMHFMLETVIAGYMLGIDPFGQPAVEQGKVLARKFLSEKPPD